MEVHMAFGGVLVRGAWGSQHVQRVLIALDLKGIPYEIVEVDEETPVLFHGGNSLQGSLAIVEYLEVAFPGTPSLLPADPDARAHARLLAGYIDEELVNRGPRLIWMLEGDAQMQARGEMVGVFKALDWELGDRDFFGGDDGFGFVDVALAPFTSSFISYERYGSFELEEVAPRVKAWWNRVEDIESVILSWL